MLMHILGLFLRYFCCLGKMSFEKQHHTYSAKSEGNLGQSSSLHVSFVIGSSNTVQVLHHTTAFTVFLMVRLRIVHRRGLGPERYATVPSSVEAQLVPPLLFEMNQIRRGMLLQTVLALSHLGWVQKPNHQRIQVFQFLILIMRESVGRAKRPAVFSTPTDVQWLKLVSRNV